MSTLTPEERARALELVWTRAAWDESFRALLSLLEIEQPEQAPEPVSIRDPRSRRLLQIEYHLMREQARMKERGNG